MLGVVEMSPFVIFCWSGCTFPPADIVPGVFDWLDDDDELGPVKNEYTVGSPRFIARAFNSTVGVTTTGKITKFANYEYVFYGNWEKSYKYKMSTRFIAKFTIFRCFCLWWRMFEWSLFQSNGCCSMLGFFDGRTRSNVFFNFSQFQTHCEGFFVSWTWISSKENLCHVKLLKFQK